jgi:hypothetical protein
MCVHAGGNTMTERIYGNEQKGRRWKGKKLSFRKGDFAVTYIHDFGI